MPVHKHIIGDERFSYAEFVSRNPETLGKTQWVDFNGGLMVGAKIGKGFGLFLEGKQRNYVSNRYRYVAVNIDIHSC